MRRTFVERQTSNVKSILINLPVICYVSLFTVYLSPFTLHASRFTL